MSQIPETEGPQPKFHRAKGRGLNSQKRRPAAQILRTKGRGPNSSERWAEISIMQDYLAKIRFSRQAQKDPHCCGAERGTDKRERRENEEESEWAQ